MKVVSNGISIFRWFGGFPRKNDAKTVPQIITMVAKGFTRETKTVYTIRRDDEETITRETFTGSPGYAALSDEIREIVDNLIPEISSLRSAIS